MQVNVISPKARRTFRYCAWCSLLVSALVLADMRFRIAIGNPLTFAGLLFSLLFAVVGMLGAISNLILIVGMFIHLLKVSRLPAASKLLWILLFITLPPFTEATYYFAVYLRSRAT